MFLGLKMKLKLKALCKLLIKWVLCYVIVM